MKNEKVIVELLGWTRDPSEIGRLSLRKEEIYRELIVRDGLTALPGVLNLLEQLRAAKVSMAIGTSTPRANIECAIRQFRLPDYFAAKVCGEDVIHGKPHPEVFLQAAKQLGTSPAQCVVFEDAHVGIEAAHAAGMKVIAVATTHPAATLTDADRVVQSLNEVSLGEVERWLAP